MQDLDAVDSTLKCFYSQNLTIEINNHRNAPLRNILPYVLTLIETQCFGCLDVQKQFAGRAGEINLLVDDKPDVEAAKNENGKRASSLLSSPLEESGTKQLKSEK